MRTGHYGHDRLHGSLVPHTISPISFVTLGGSGFGYVSWLSSGSERPGFEIMNKKHLLSDVQFKFFVPVQVLPMPLFPTMDHTRVLAYLPGP